MAIGAPKLQHFTSLIKSKLPTTICLMD